MNVDGKCLCGAVTFEAELNPKLVFICHCSDCQTQSGSAFRTIAGALPESFRLTSGELKVFEKRAESGAVRLLAFCPDCGTPIHAQPPAGEKGLLSLRVGVLRQREQLRPVAQLWCRSALGWIGDIGELPRVETQPDLATRAGRDPG